MSLFPRHFHQELSPIFRMMDDYANITRDLQSPNGNTWKSLRSFQPKFDVSETKDAYQLHGELPGIEQKNINIEWSDSNTLTISGRTEHRRESGPEQGKVTGEAEEHHYEKPSVEEEAGTSTKAANGETSESTEVAKTGSQEVANQEDRPKYWVSERSVGEFHRSFSFPARVDQDNVKARLNNGILEITVPKATKPAARKIEIGQ
ncbi:30 kDa heat shock protein [Rhizodiscina lignyota]|uniref:30 kDa heat shock protein n=1 Tax=Rhizodiscina lignyota TaxID=1504668 RepID=A0A9P4M5X9_9PEZI|nr:30 kDa heat shock protein [Rhizodiscina lignyota]